MFNILLMIHVLVSAGLIGLVLLQHGRGADAGAAFGSGASSTVFGARGSASFLTRATAGLATVFFVTSLSLAYLTGHRQEHKSVTETAVPATSDVPATPAAPASVPAQPAPGVQPKPAPSQQVPSDVPAPSPEKPAPAPSAERPAPAGPAQPQSAPDVPSPQ